jgi:hypothetical protein
LPTNNPRNDIHAFRTTELPQSATANRPAHIGCRLKGSLQHFGEFL